MTWVKPASFLITFASLAILAALVSAQEDTNFRRPKDDAERLRVLIETDAGGDPDDEQSLVRFLLYANEFDVEGVICTLAKARDKENLNPERTGLGIVRRQLKAYGECHPNLVKHDRRYPTQEDLWRRTVAGYGSDAGVKLILAAADAADPRPIWICNWGTGHDSDESSFKLALDRVLKERGQAGYAKFKSRFRASHRTAQRGRESLD
jgi:hypothetical protein